MAEITISSLPITNTYSANDRVVILSTPDTTPVLKTIQTQYLDRLITTAPVSRYANGIAGQIAYDNTSFYVCVSNNTWGKVSLNLAW